MRDRTPLDERLITSVFAADDSSMPWRKFV